MYLPLATEVLSYVLYYISPLQCQGWLFCSDFFKTNADQIRIEPHQSKKGTSVYMKK
jgi:hypothetical protein